MSNSEASSVERSGSSEWTTYYMGLERTVAAPLFLLSFSAVAVDAWDESIPCAIFFAMLGLAGFWLIVFRLRLRVSDELIEARNVWRTRVTSLERRRHQLRVRRDDGAVL